MRAARRYTDLEYRYSATQNNGRITQLKNWVSGEEVNYQYDALQRLSSASTTGPEWGLNFSYDGFGNKTAQTVTEGNGSADERNIRSGDEPDDRGAARCNGNVLGTTGTLYDIENRTGTWDGAESYGYAPDNRRVWRRYTAGGLTWEDYTLRGLNGKPMGTYRLMWDDNEEQGPWTLRFQMQGEAQVWFGSEGGKAADVGW